jgi:peptide/nickel transport system ATP-binding protein
VNNPLSIGESPPQRKRAAVDPVLEVQGLRVVRSHRDRPETIVSSVDLSLAAGETIGIVGESGSGKSMTVRAITGLLPPGLDAEGDVRYGGRNLLGLRGREWRALRGREIGLIMQDPFTMLNPLARCGNIVRESLPHERALSRPERRSAVVRRLAEVGISDETVVDRYPFQLSGGMRQRVAIAAALARDPAVLIADEPSTALDVATQREILALIKRIQQARGMSLILITHDLRVAFAICDRIYVLYAGSLVEVGGSAELEAEPLHPYSHGLLMSEPPTTHRVRELVAIPGSVPSPDSVANRCAFAPRCRWVTPDCRQTAPPLVEMAPGRLSACARLPEIRAELAAVRESAQPAAQPLVAQRAVPTIIRVRDARKDFHSGKRRVTVIDNVSLEVGADESVGLVGESGSGKTTLARMLVGLEHLTGGGEISIAGIPSGDWSKLRGKDRRMLRGTVQMIFQDPYSSLNPMRTIGATLAEAITTHDATAKLLAKQVTDLLASVGLPGAYAQRKPAALSGGERQRVAIARALAANPRILICDEPVSALDVSVQAQILNLFTRLKNDRGIGYLFITHDLSVVRQISDYLYVMYRGRIVESGPTDDVFGSPQHVYTRKLINTVSSAEPD